MTRFTLSFQLSNPPRCPVCQSDLNPHATQVLANTAFCWRCYQYATWAALGLEVQWAVHEGDGTNYATRHNITFYTPPPQANRHKSAAQQLWRHKRNSTPIDDDHLCMARTFKQETPPELLPQ